MMSLGMNFGAGYFEGSGEDATIDVGDAELALPERIHAMTYDDRSLDPVTLTQSGSDVMSGFLKGSYAMTVQGTYNARPLRVRPRRLRLGDLAGAVGRHR